MRVLVIGGSGLISSAIVRQLLARGDRVTVFTRGRSDRAPAEGVEHLTGDRHDAPAFERCIRAAGEFDAVIDMICFRPEEARSVVRAVSGRTRQLVLCSTVDVYAKPGGRSRHPIREDEPQLGLNDYSRGKVACERILREAESAGAFALTVLRPAHTYDDRGALIHSFGGGTHYLDRLRRGLPVIVHGDGTSLWCMAHAEDVGRAFVGATGNPKAFGRAYNVAGEQWLAWDQMYRIVCDVKGWPGPQLVHIPADLLARVAPRHGNILLENFSHPNVFDNSAARTDLGYRYEIDFAEGVRRVTGWLERHGKIEPAESRPWYDRLIELWRAQSEQFASAGAGIVAGG